MLFFARVHVHLSAAPTAGDEVTAKPDPESHASYRFTDRSLVRPALTRLWFARLFPLLPRWLAANLVTLASTGALLAVLGLSLDAQRWPPAMLAIVFLLTMQVYVAGDHLDGMQAVASGTTSPLGDFLDHFCDLWAGCILVFGFWALLGSPERGVLFALEALLILAFAVTYAEREERRALHFTRYGTLEAIVILSVFFLTWTVPGVRAWWRSELLAGLPWYSLIIATGVAMAVGAIGVIVRRMGTVHPAVAVLTAGLLAQWLVLSRWVEISPVAGWFLMALYGAGYVASVMHGYLVPGHRSWPDPLATVAIIGVAVWDVLVGVGAGHVPAVAFWLGVYLALSTTRRLLRVLASLRRYWVWVNAGGVTRD